MGTLLRGISERFNPQIHTEVNSLTVNMAKDMAIKNKTFDLFASKNKFISWLYATGRVNMGAQAGKVMKANNSIHDNAFRIAYKGSLFIPAYSWGKAKFSTVKSEIAAIVDFTAELAGVTYGTGVAVPADISHDVYCAVSVMHDPANNIFGDKFNEGDVISLGNYLGTSIIVAGGIGSSGSVKAASDDHYVVYGKVSSKSGLFVEAHLAAGELFAEAGNRFGEGSEKGFQRERRTKWRINYSFISRATLTMTGSALNQKVAVIYNDETKATMWELEAVMDLREKHAMDMEMGARHARMSMDPTSHQWYENYGSNLLTLDGFTAAMGIVAPVIGDGWIPQLEDSFTIGYDPNVDLPLEKIELFITILAQRAPNGSTGNTFIVLGDKLAHIKIDKALKLLIGVSSNAATTTLNNSNVVYNVRTGEQNKVGFTVDKYYYLENEIIFIEDELSNHPAFAPQNGGIIGTGTMYVLNASMVNGVSNIDLLSRANRELRAKYIDGMHSLDSSRDSSPVAFSGFDGGRFDLLSEVLPIIYSTESCGIIKASAKFTGGALTGEPVVTEKATVWHY